MTPKVHCVGGVQLKAWYFLHVPQALTFRNPRFCPHGVFMCFVWISEQTTVVPLYSIKWLVFI